MTHAKRRYDLQDSHFFRLKSIHVLARLLRIRVGTLRKGSPLFTKYFFGEVPKSGSETRKTETPYGELRKVHERILDLFSRINVPDYLHSGIKKRSYVTNAQHHIGSYETYALDIKKFFPNTTWFHIFNFFRSRMECGEDIATILANMLTVDGHLPTGSPVSTLFSYYAHKEMFDRLDEFAQASGIRMSLYVDDLNFSGTRIAGEFKHRVQREIRRDRLKFHKERHYRTPDSRKITGAIVGENGMQWPRRHHLAAYTTNLVLRNAEDLASKERAFRGLLGRVR